MFGVYLLFVFTLLAMDAHTAEGKEEKSAHYLIRTMTAAETDKSLDKL